MKRILFVDDEVELLDSFRARLHKRRHDWDMVFLSSGADVFRELEKQPADLIVSDVRMPGIHGAELLAVLRQHWPEMIRIVLSGFADQAQLMQLVPLAHQYVSKPCDAGKLENIIERCLRLHELLRQPTLRAAVGRIGALPPTPRVYSQLQHMLADPNVSSASLAEWIGHDPAIACKVMQVANSAFFRLAKPVTRIKDAVTYLGFGSIRNLVMSAEVFAQWEKVASVSGVSVVELQHHALQSAAATAALCTDQALVDDAWLAGLVHDIGYWIMVKECPDELTRVVALIRDEHQSACEAERQVLGATHAAVGAYLLGLWGLHYPLVEAVAMHHEAQHVAPHGYDLLAMVATANALLPESTELDQLLPCRVALTESEFLAFTPPYDWHDAMRRVNQAISTPLE